MSDMDKRLMRQCWANTPSALGHPTRCHARVPADPDHLGLCDDCRDRLRNLEWPHEAEAA